MKQIQQKPRSRVLLYLLLLVAVVGLMMSLRKCRRGLVEPSVSAADTVRVAMQYAPGSFYLSGDSLAGVDYRALTALGLPYKIFPITNPAEGLTGLRQGRYDVVVADLPLTADSTEEYIFTDPVYLDRQVLVQRLDSVGAAPAITSPVQLVGHTVCVPEGSPVVTRLNNLEREIGGDITLVERPVNSERLLMELALGADSVNLVVANSVIAAEMARDYPLLDYSVPVSLTQFQPWVLRKDERALRDTINARLARIPK